jgi:hypothetical protein
MSTHDTDHDRTDAPAASDADLDAEGTYADAEGADDVEGTDDVEPGYFERDDARDDDDTEDDGDEAIDTEGLADPEVEPAPIALGPTADDDAAGSATTAYPAPGDVETYGDSEDDVDVEPVVVELDESEVEVLDDPDAEPYASDADDNDESVLLTETEPGSVLPPEEPDHADSDDDAAVGDEVVVEDVVVEPVPAPEPVEPELVEPVEPVPADADADDPESGLAKPSAAEMLTPTAADGSIDPGTGSYQERWSAIQGSFVDEPYRAVEAAGALVTQMWDDFERTIVERRNALDSSWADASPTDELRDAFKQYRDLFRHLQTLVTDDGPA